VGGIVYTGYSFGEGVSLASDRYDGHKNGLRFAFEIFVEGATGLGLVSLSLLSVYGGYRAIATTPGASSGGGGGGGGGGGSPTPPVAAPVKPPTPPKPPSNPQSKEVGRYSFNDLKAFHRTLHKQWEIDEGPGIVKPLDD
jgi:hypothetical protein